MKYREECSGMEDQFHTSGVFEISKFDISKFACISYFPFWFCGQVWVQIAPLVIA